MRILGSPAFGKLSHRKYRSSPQTFPDWLQADAAKGSRQACYKPCLPRPAIPLILVVDIQYMCQEAEELGFDSKQANPRCRISRLKQGDPRLLKIQVCHLLKSKLPQNMARVGGLTTSLSSYLLVLRTLHAPTGRSI